MEHRPSAATCNPTPELANAGITRLVPPIRTQAVLPPNHHGGYHHNDRQRANLQLGTDLDGKETSKTDAATMLATQTNWCGNVQPTTATLKILSPTSHLASGRIATAGIFADIITRIYTSCTSWRDG